MGLNLFSKIVLLCHSLKGQNTYRFKQKNLFFQSMYFIENEIKVIISLDNLELGFRNFEKKLTKHL